MTATATATVHHHRLAGWRAALDAPTGRLDLVNVPMGNFLMFDGSGDVRDDGFSAAIRALADLSTCLRLYLQDSDHSLLDPLPIEILRSAPEDEEDEAWDSASVAAARWTAMVAQPDGVTPDLFAAVRERLVATRTDPALQRVHLGSLREGLCVQTAYSAARERRSDVLERLIAQARELGYQPRGPHHEIYLADLRHIEAAPLRAIVRQPVHRTP